MADRDAVSAARDRVIATWGTVDAWVDCAMSTLVGPIAELKSEDFERVVRVTLMGCVHGTKAALEVMRPKNSGSIVQVGSALAYCAIPNQTAYCACKFAIRGFADSLRAELVHEKSAIRLTMLQMPGMNTIQFDWAKNLFSRKYQPVGDVFDPEVAADAAWRAVRDGPRELWVGGSAIQSTISLCSVRSLSKIRTLGSRKCCSRRSAASSAKSVSACNTSFRPGARAGRPPNTVTCCSTPSLRRSGISKCSPPRWR